MSQPPHSSVFFDTNMSNAHLPPAGQLALQFVPTNPLELGLQSTVQNKPIAMNEFLNQFINQQVIVLLNKDPGNPPQMQEISPVTFNRDNGKQFMATFTSPERMKAFCDQFPQFKFALGMHVGFLIQSINSNVGIAVNPGCPVGFEWHAEGVQDAKGRIDWARAPWNQPQQPAMTGAPTENPNPTQA
jgi:hypothetical protein